MPAFVDVSGKRFGRLTALRRVPRHDQSPPAGFIGYARYYAYYAKNRPTGKSRIRPDSAGVGTVHQTLGKVGESLRNTTRNRAVDPVPLPAGKDQGGNPAHPRLTGFFA